MRGATDEDFYAVWDRLEFQSTLPVRGATISPGLLVNYQNDFNPRSPCGERLYEYLLTEAIKMISIHAPRAGSDAMTYDGFNMTAISIHAPRAGSDPG